MQYGTKHPQQQPAKTQSAAETICVRLLGTYSTLVTIDLLQVGQVVPVGPGPILPVRGPCAGGVVMTVVRGPKGGTTNPGGGGGLSPKYDGGGAGLGLVCS